MNPKYILNSLFLVVAYFLCTSMVIYQFSMTMVTWLVTKPTSMSMKSRPFTAEDLPSITVCPVPGFDIEKLNSAGYSSLWNYYLGNLDCGNKSTCPLSWNGKHGNVTMENLVTVENIENISTVEVYLKTVHEKNKNKNIAT